MTLNGAIKQLQEIQSNEDVPFYIKPAIKEVINVLLMDTQEIKHGQWIKNEAESALHVEPIYDCSACHNWQAWGSYERTPYCPNCGADMREKREDGKDC